ncbi:MAG TPA: hydantoinase/oxoprolinase family protein, partial [Beutenbergiaceae bacterium]|nr:hydantoinase/oxoprolinase family protein [Beutenbergiaceae bacterium]
VGEGNQLPFYVMKSNGGVISADEVVHQPITTVLSGPAAGALGAALISQQAGFDKVLTLDGGGTSTDVTVVIDGEPSLTTEGSIGNFPTKVPMIDVVTVGAGGGSIAHLAPDGTMKVGPKSAGADPGPICYDNGGREVTVTDAHVFLGRIPPHLLGGEIPLNVDAAAEAISELAQALGISPLACATGILEISAWHQANALREITVKRGLDVREFTLTTFGGSGSLLACRLMDILDIDTVVVPLNPGNLSAFGLLTVDIRNDYVQTQVSLHDILDLTAASNLFRGLTQKAAHALSLEGFDPSEHHFQRSADLRYFGQAFEVRVPVPEGPFTQEVADQVADSFHEAHRALYGYDFKGDPDQHVEWVNFRVTGVGYIQRPELTPEPLGDGTLTEPTTTRAVCFDADIGPVETAVWGRMDLQPGVRFTGPAIVEEFGATIPIHPGFTVVVDEHRNLILTREGA